MAVDLHAVNMDAPAPSGFTIERVSNGQALQKWGKGLDAGLGLPDFVSDAFVDFFDGANDGEQRPPYHYTGWLNDTPVASPSVFFGAGVAGIYNVANAPKARRQGIGALVTLAPLLDARRMGYRVGILHSAKMGVNVYRQLGFQEYCTIGHYVWLPEREQAAE